MELLAFILVSIGVLVVPGPTVMVVVSISVTHGRRRGLQTVAGSSIAMFIQLLVAAIGTSWFVSSLATGFFWLKWLGVGYLVYLGLQLILNSGKENAGNISASGSFIRGFWVTLTNPKTILFFSAFLPQFTLQAGSYATQIFTLSLVFWLLAIVLDSGYVILSSKLSPMLKAKGLSKHQGKITGSIYLGAGAVLATTRNA
jgi:threonine/homoserine/homoserine lactone efflux protein